MEQLPFADELKDPAHGDLVVRLNQGQAAFHVHRAVLALASPVFSALLTNGMRESAQAVVDLVEEHLDHARAVGQLLAGLYPYHRTTIDMANVRALLHLGDKYQLRPRLREECEAFLLTLPAAWDLMLLAQRYAGLDALLDRQAQWVAANVRLFRLRPELLVQLEAATVQRVVAHIAKLVHGLDPHPGRVLSHTGLDVDSAQRVRAVFPFH
jgi:hypothetical protein